MHKIFYIGSFQKLWDEEGIARALEDLGCEVTRFESSNFRFNEFRDKCLSNRPDLIMWAKLNIDFGIRNYLTTWIENSGIKTACYMPDLYWGLSRQWKAQRRDTHFKAQYILSPDGGHDEQWKEAKINHLLLRQGIPKDFAYIADYDPKFDFDIVFVGQLNPEYPYRTKLIEWLRKEYAGKFKWFGKADSDEIRGHELNKLYASSKIIIGESVYSPHYWSNRIYETIGRGGFIIHPAVPGLDQEYKPYEHYIPYYHNDFEALKEIINHFLSRPDERRKIATAGFEYTKQNYTLHHRCKTLLNYIL